MRDAIVMTDRIKKEALTDIVLSNSETFRMKKKKKIQNTGIASRIEFLYGEEKQLAPLITTLQVFRFFVFRRTATSSINCLIEDIPSKR